MRLILALMTVLTALPAAAAERALSADEFAQMVTGKTLYFDRYGEAFGAEQYYEDSRVTWAFEDGTCQRGIWFANAEGEICFVYDTNPQPQCWTFLETPDGAFHARLAGANPSEDLITRSVDTAPLECPLPDLGV